MERFVTDERTGLKYELVGDYYLFDGDDEPSDTCGISESTRLACMPSC